MRKAQSRSIQILVAMLFFALHAQADILLSDIVGGGDGSGTAPAENVGIHPDTGEFSTQHVGAIWNSGDGLVPVPDSEYVDSVFLITQEENPITTTGITQSFAFEDILIYVDPDTLEETWGGGYDVICKDCNPDRPDQLLAGTVSFGTGVGVHSSGGITFDLGAIRTAHGDNAVNYVSAVAGGDDCGTMDVVLSMILSSQDAVLQAKSFPCLANQAAFMQLEITADARYLTLVTAANGVSWCDHGTFAEARITAEPVDDTITNLSLRNFPGVLAGASPVQIYPVVELIAYGALVTPEGTTYSSSDTAVFDIDDQGLLTPVDFGSADVIVSVGPLQVTRHALVGIDLGGIAANGSGFEPPDPAAGIIGINPDTGQWATARLNADVTNTSGNNPQPVAASDMINAVFLLLSDFQAISVDQDGLPEAEHEFPNGNSWTNGWDNILNGWEPGGPDYLDMGPAGIYYNGLGVHAAAGITFDLAELKAWHGADTVKYFYTVAGEGAGQLNPAGQPIDAHVIASDGIVSLGEWEVSAAVDHGETLTAEIPETAQYLTFAVGTAGTGIGSAHGCFAQAVIAPEAVDTSLGELLVAPAAATVRGGDQIQLTVTGIIAMTGVPADVTGIAAYESSNTNVATVDAAGLVSAVNNGQAEITASHQGLAAVAVFDVVDFPFSQVYVSPAAATMRSGETLQLAVTAVREFDGALIDVTGEATYQSGDAAVADVAASGLITAGQLGKTDITVTFETVELTVPIVVMTMIDLGAIVGGGDGGQDVLPTYVGINPATGMFDTNLDLNAVNPSGDNPQSVDTSMIGLDFDFIDSVFIMVADSMTINTQGESYDFAAGDLWASTWDLIADTVEADAPPGTLQLGPQGTFTAGIGLHASAGITFDLDAIRGYHGAHNVSFVSATMGEGSIGGGGSVNCYMILTDGMGVILDDAAVGPYTDDGEFAEIEIPDAAVFLTLAVGCAGNDIGGDHGVFGNAFITDCSLLDPDNCGVVVTTGFKRGDANRDGSVNIADAVYILQNLFASGPAILCPDAADANDDEGVNIADAVYILQNLFADGPAIPAPGPDTCGPDTTGHPTGGPELDPCDYPQEECQGP